MIKNAVVYYVFKRAELVALVMNRIRDAKPKVVFLFSDGPRDNIEKELILKSRDAAIKSIDWDCKVHTHFLEENIGIDKMWDYSFTTTFEAVDKAIFIEEDILPNLSFFYYCDELLARYEEDKRIFMITGINALSEYPSSTGPSYFFTTSNSTWGFAFWKRSFDLMSKDLSILLDHYYGPVVKDYFYRDNNRKSIRAYNRLITYSSKPDLIQKYKNEISEIWFHDYNQFLLNNMLTIVPRVNLIQNLGNHKESENSDTNQLLTKKMKRVYEMKIFDLNFPLTHPDFILLDRIYKKKLKVLRKESFFLRLIERSTRAVKILRYNGLKAFLSKVKKNISRYIDFMN